MLWSRSSRVRRLQRFPCSLRQPSAMEVLDPLQSALLASASDMSPQTLPSSPEATMVMSGKRLFLDICAGATRPLSQAALQAGMHVLSVDPLCAGQLDLFNDLHYEQLLRLSFSGPVWFACASPPCETSVPLSSGQDRAPSQFALGSILLVFPTQVLLNWSAFRKACAFWNVQSPSYWQFSKLGAIQVWSSPQMLCPGGSPWCNITCWRSALHVAVLLPALLA